MNIQNKFKSILLVGARFATLFVLSAMAFVYVRNNKNASHVIEIETSYIDDYTNDQVLLGASHNVFVGKILNQIGTKDIGIGPETQFSVQVISDIKGSLSGIVTVDQQGGYQNGMLYVVGEDDVPGLSSEDGPNYLLQPGETYLLATRYNPTENWYTLNSFPTASKLLSADDSLNTTQLQAITANDPRVAQLQAAYPHEILLVADVAHNNTLNSYASTHPVQPPPPLVPTSTLENSGSITMTSSTSSNISASSNPAAASVSSQGTSVSTPLGIVTSITTGGSKNGGSVTSTTSATSSVEN